MTKTKAVTEKPKCSTKMPETVEPKKFPRYIDVVHKAEKFKVKVKIHINFKSNLKYSILKLRKVQYSL